MESIIALLSGIGTVVGTVLGYYSGRKLEREKREHERWLSGIERLRKLVARDETIIQQLVNAALSVKQQVTSLEWGYAGHATDDGIRVREDLIAPHREKLANLEGLVSLYADGEVVAAFVGFLDVVQGVAGLPQHEGRRAVEEAFGELSRTARAFVTQRNAESLGLPSSSIEGQKLLPPPSS